MALNLIQRITLFCVVLWLSSGGLLPSTVAGQQVSVEGLPTLAGQAEDHLRIGQLLGKSGTEGYLLRTPSTLFDQMVKDDAAWSISLLAPEIRGIDNSDLPSSFNDGALWAGRGWNHLITIGGRARLGRLTLTLAPQFIYQENQPFPFIVYPLGATPERRLHANPFHPEPESMDLPMRFGTEPLDKIDWGQSTIAINAGPLNFGFSTENAWWGPGIRNGILMSNQAAGVPRAFLRTREPIMTRLGEFEGLWILGHLKESDFFDGEPSNDRRTLNGIALTNGLTRVTDHPGRKLGYMYQPLDRPL